MFFIFGLITLVWLIPWQRVIGALPAGHVAHREPMVPISQLVGRWPLWAMGVGHACSKYGFYFLLAWLPLYLVQQRGLSIQEMTLLATLGYAVQAAAALTWGHISDRWTRSGRSEAAMRRGMLAGGQFVLGAAILGICLSGSMLAVGIWLCLAGAATASLSCNLYAMGQMFAGRRAAGSWIGFQNSVGNLSGILQPIIAGILIDRSGYDGAFYLAATVTVFGGLWWIFAVPKVQEIELADAQV
jgi:MFS family permease